MYYATNNIPVSVNVFYVMTFVEFNMTENTEIIHETDSNSIENNF